MIDIRAIEGKYSVVYSSTRNICDEEVRKELEKEEINIKLESITYWGFSIKSEHGPTGKWHGFFTVQKNYPYFALGEYQYECDRNNKLLDRKGEHNFIFDPSDLCVLVHGRDKSPSGKSVGKPFSLVFHKEP